MRIKFTLVLACVLSASAAIQAKAQGAAQVSSFKGTQAATFVQFGPSVVCADGSIGTASGIAFISGSESMSQQPGTPKSISSGGLIEIFGYSDSCTGTSIGFGIGGFSGGYTAPNRSLSSAAISGTTTIQDLDTGASYPVNLNLAFTGTGSVQTSRGTSVSHDVPGYTVTVSHGASSVRDAGVTGTITINGSQPDALYSSTTLVSNTNGQTSVQKK